MPPPAVSPDQILDHAPKTKARIVKVDANVAAYFGDLFHAMRKGLKEATTAGAPTLKPAPPKSAHKGPSGTGVAQNPT
jgi:hypothetical protein